MNHTIRLVPLLCLACTLGCFVPSVEELAETHPVTEYACNDTYNACPEGLQCLAGFCRQVGEMYCMPGTKRACGGYNLGICKYGEQTCGDDAVYSTDCVGEILPVAEVCGDNKDNDCDGMTDVFRSNGLADKVTPGMNMAAAVLSDSGTLLVVTAEATDLVVRTRKPNGELTSGRKFMSAPATRRLLTPRIVAEKDVAMVAWAEETSGTGRTEARIFVARMDKDGKLTTSAIAMNYAMKADAHVVDMALAMNDTHILVVALTSNPSPTETVGETLHARVSVIVKNLQNASVHLDETNENITQLEAPEPTFGLFATSNAMHDKFLIAYSAMGDARAKGDIKTYVIDTNATIAEGFYVSDEAERHSPFIIPDPGSDYDHQLLYVRSDKGVSTIVSATCNTRVSEACSLERDPLLTSEYPITRAQMMLPPNAKLPRYALAALQDRAQSRDFLAILTLPNSSPPPPSAAPPPPIEVVGSGTVAETVASAPQKGSIDHVVYLQSPGAGQPLKAHLQPLCLP